MLQTEPDRQGPNRHCPDKILGGRGVTSFYIVLVVKLVLAGKNHKKMKLKISKILAEK